MKHLLYRMMARLRHRVFCGPSCQEVAGFLTQLVEGQLSEDVVKRYERHLRTCPPCGNHFQQYKQSMELARQNKETKIPADLVEHTLAFLRERRAAE